MGRRGVKATWRFEFHGGSQWKSLAALWVGTWEDAVTQCARISRTHGRHKVRVSLRPIQVLKDTDPSYGYDNFGSDDE